MRFMRHDSLGRSLAMALLLLAHSAAATTVARRDFSDLVARAEQVVVGTVTKISQDTDSNGAPRTLVTFEDLSILKGSVGSSLTLDFYGGRDGEHATAISDMPIFQEGERAVLFVAGNGKAICPLVGIWQGRFRVRFDEQLGTEVVESNDGRAVTGRQRRALILAPQDPGVANSSKPLTLDQFRGLVADELAHPAAE
jgi:hypothetical protein